MTTGAIAEGAGHARYTFRVRLSKTARRGLEAEWGRCRWIWNECVARSKKAHDEGEKVGPAALDRMLTEARRVTPWLAVGSSVPQQQLVRDFGKSRTKALKDGRLHLAGGIVVRVVWSRELPADPSSVRVYQDSTGAWYASFVVPAPVEPLRETGRVMGVDWGVKVTATTTSDAHDLPHPQYGKTAAHKLARYQRMTARRKPKRGQAASNGYRAAKAQTAKLHKKVARQRQDTARMGSPLLERSSRAWGRAKAVVRDHDTLAVEDFRPKFLARTTMARKAADAAVGAAKTALLEMARKHGRIVHLVHPAHTTMDCAQCGARTKHALPLSERTYACTACGAISPRDKNSARVMLVRAGLNPAGVEGVRPSGAPPRMAA